MAPPPPTTFGPAPPARIAAAWLLLCIILLATGWARIGAGQLPDPDDALRLVQVRDLLAGQDWFDPVQHRIDPPAGTPMHWSRLVDLLLLLAATTVGEQAMLVLVPLLTLGIIVWATGQLAARVAGREAVLYACLACGFMPALVMQVQPLRIDHHGWQAACVALALLALASERPRTAGALAGVALAAGLTISVELLPLSAVFAALLAWRWWRDGRLAAGLPAYLQALAAGLVVLFLLTRGAGATTAWCDAISLPHLALFTVVAIGATVAERLRLRPARALALIGGSAVLGLLLLGRMAPQCLAPPFAALDPLVHDYWYIHIAEGQPLWRQPWDRAVPALVPLLAGLASAVAIRARSPRHLRAWWTGHALLLLAALLAGLLVARSLAFAAVIAAVPLGWLLAQLLDRLRTAGAAAHKGLAAAALVGLLVPSAPFILAQKFWPAARPAAAPKLADAPCDVRARAASLKSLPPGLVFAPLDLGPAILLESGHAVVATSHHRAESAMADVIRAFTAPPGAARGVISRHQADYLALCTDLAEARLYAGRHPGGLAGRLAAGRPPEWLEPVSGLSTGTFRLYRVRPQPR